MTIDQTPRQGIHDAIKTNDADDDLRARTASMGSVFQRTDRILSGDFDLHVNVVSNDEARSMGCENVAGWTDGENIHLNRDVIRNLMLDAKDAEAARSVLASLYGVNLHELAHVLFTPRVSDAISSRIQGYGEFAWQVFNVLEDQRAETLFVATYGPSREHFRRVVLRQILDRNDPDNYGGLAVLVWGRKFIGASLRKRFARMLREQVGTPTANELLSLIDEYRLLAYPADETRMEEIILEFAALMQNDAPDLSGIVGQLAADHSHVEQGDASEDQEGPAATAAADSPDDTLAELDEDEDDDETGDTSSDDSSASDSDSPSEDGSEGDADDGSSEGEADASDDGEDEGDGSPFDGASSEAGNEPSSDNPTPNEIADAISDMLADTDERYENDVDTLSDSIRKELDKHDEATAHGSRRSYAQREAKVAEVTVARRVSKAFRDMKAQLEASWERKHDSGRINVADYLNADRGDFDVFDRYDPGAEEATEIEMVIAIDLSSSMRGQAMEQAATALWQIRTALSKLDARVTVFGYNFQHHVLAGPNDAPHRLTLEQFYPDGGTHPAETLLESYRMLRRSRRANRLFVTLTDGAWADGTPFYFRQQTSDTISNDDIVREMNREGIITAVFGFAQAVKHYGDHGAHFAHDLSNGNELVRAVEGLVMEAVRRQAVHVRG